MAKVHNRLLSIHVRHINQEQNEQRRSAHIMLSSVCSISNHAISVHAKLCHVHLNMLKNYMPQSVKAERSMQRILCNTENIKVNILFFV